MQHSGPKYDNCHVWVFSLLIHLTQTINLLRKLHALNK